MMFVITLEDVIAVALILIVCVALVVGVMVRVIKEISKGGRHGQDVQIHC